MMRVFANSIVVLILFSEYCTSFASSDINDSAAESRFLAKRMEETERSLETAPVIHTDDLARAIVHRYVDWFRAVDCEWSDWIEEGCLPCGGWIGQQTYLRVRFPNREYLNAINQGEACEGNGTDCTYVEGCKDLVWKTPLGPIEDPIDPIQPGGRKVEAVPIGSLDLELMKSVADGYWRWFAPVDCEWTDWIAEGCLPCGSWPGEDRYLRVRFQNIEYLNAFNQGEDCEGMATDCQYNRDCDGPVWEGPLGPIKPIGELTPGTDPHGGGGRHLAQSSYMTYTGGHQPDAGQDDNDTSDDASQSTGPQLGGKYAQPLHTVFEHLQHHHVNDASNTSTGPVMHATIEDMRIVEVWHHFFAKVDCEWSAWIAEGCLPCGNSPEERHLRVRFPNIEYLEAFNQGEPCEGDATECVEVDGCDGVVWQGPLGDDPDGNPIPTRN